MKVKEKPIVTTLEKFDKDNYDIQRKLLILKLNLCLQIEANLLKLESKLLSVVSFGYIN